VERPLPKRVPGIVYSLPVVPASGVIGALTEGRNSRRFIAASDLERFVQIEKRGYVAEVFGVTVGVGAIHGRVLTLLRIGSGNVGPALLCRAESGERFLIEGGHVESVDRFFEEENACITWQGESIAKLDVTALYRSVEKQLWERRWISREQLETKTPH